MPDFAKGVVKFQNDIFPQKKALFDRLAVGQSPEALFITCSDARIDAGLITQTDPGALFICRNAGNIIPPHTNHTGAMTASVEYAVAALKVPHIVVCGHAGCGAMHGALRGDILKDLPHMRNWLGYSNAAVKIVEEVGAGKPEAERLEMLVEQNVILQIRHLETHPTVAVRMARGDLKLHGWIYDIKNGRVRAYDSAADAFIPVEKHYAAEIAGSAP